MSSKHRGQLSVAVEAVTNSSRSDLVFTKALLSCVLKGLLGQLDWFSHLRFCVAITLAATYIDCITVPADLHAQALVITPVEHVQHVLCVSATEAKSFNSLDILRAITPDALLTESSAPGPETACNSLSLPPPRRYKEIDRRSAVILADT